MCKILIIDDSEDCQQCIIDCLELTLTDPNHPIKIETCDRINTAIAKLNNGSGFNVVFVDGCIEKPNDGLELIEKIRQLQKKIIIIAISNNYECLDMAKKSADYCFPKIKILENLSLIKEIFN